VRFNSVLCFGDSLTWGRDPVTGGRHDVDGRWPARLQQSIGSTVQVLVDGLPGRTAGPDDPRLPYPTAGPPQLAHSLLVNGPVELVILMLGTNDLQDHLFNGVDVTANAIVGLAEAAQNCAPGRDWVPEVVLLAPPPIDTSVAAVQQPSFAGAAGRAEALAARLKTLCKHSNLLLFETRIWATPQGGDGVHFMRDQAGSLGEGLARALIKVSS
jgi:lysophospholipase L1-like esterase